MTTSLSALKDKAIDAMQRSSAKLIILSVDASVELIILLVDASSDGSRMLSS
jgi:ribosomal protein L7Ae-like RNA K-turn-binding protein